MLTVMLCFYVKAQTSDIQIKVISESEKEPLVGATVYFKALKKGEVTNLDGIVTFSEIDNNNYTIIISYLGFQEVVEL